jgi:NAD(P)H-dependent flavin oxidoreductase YrpB (nitropropane dioxygenase family)
VLRTAFTELLGIEWPIVQAGMGGVARAPLATAVSEAGGLGTIAHPGVPAPALCAEIRQARRLTTRPLAVNFLLPLFDPEAFAAALAERIDAVIFFWGDIRPHVAAAQAAGVKVGVQVGSVDEAAAAADAGVDFVIAQGVEAGGHVRGTASTLVLVPLVADRVRPLPVAAAGGIGDARGIVAVLAAGADAAVLGSRFMLTPEASVHPRYREALAGAGPEDTVLTTLFDVEWPDAPHRVLRTATIRAWEAAGRPPTGRRPGEGEQVATMRMGEVAAPILRYSITPPMADTDGDVDALCFYAGQSCGLARTVEPAGALVRRLAQEAAELIRSRLAPLAT